MATGERVRMWLMFDLPLLGGVEGPSPRACACGAFASRRRRDPPSMPMFCCVDVDSSTALYKLVAEFTPVSSQAGTPGAGRRQLVSLNTVGSNSVLVMFLGFMSNGGSTVYPACDATCVLVRERRARLRRMAHSRCLV